MAGQELRKLQPLSWYKALYAGLQKSSYNGSPDLRQAKILVVDGGGAPISAAESKRLYFEDVAAGDTAPVALRFLHPGTYDNASLPLLQKHFSVVRPTPQELIKDILALHRQPSSLMGLSHVQLLGHVTYIFANRTKLDAGLEKEVRSDDLR
jgi:hypothetical protein